MMKRKFSHRDPDTSHSSPLSRRWDLYKRVIFLAVGTAAFLILLASFIDATLQILLLLFLCVLLAISIRGISDRLAAHTPLSEKASLGVVILGLLIVLIGAGVLMGSGIAEQFSQLGEAIPEALRQLEARLGQYSWGRPIAQEIPSLSQLGQQIASTSDAFARITGIFSSALSFLSSVVIAFFITLYLALEPKTYRDNFLRLIPLGKRARVRDTLKAIHDTLQKWLLTRLISMALVGGITFVGLSLIGMPLTLSLAILAAIGAFIPTFGPIIALIPALLLALTQGSSQLVLVLLLYLGVQAADNYLVTPVIQKSMLYLPPAYIIAAQLLFGVIAGAFGVLLAAPLAAVLVVLVRMLYVEDVLGDRESSAA
jgi:predicted PurR-regulated permease PerM